MLSKSGRHIYGMPWLVDKWLNNDCQLCDLPAVLAAILVSASQWCAGNDVTRFIGGLSYKKSVLILYSVDYPDNSTIQTTVILEGIMWILGFRSASTLYRWRISAFRLSRNLYKHLSFLILLYIYLRGKF